jgi:hypothetical protein
VSDAEHELLVDNDALLQDVERLRTLARRAVEAAIAAQDAASGSHEPWLDDARRELDE